MNSLSGRVVAITGASAGIGRATARRLAREGAAVVVSARRTDRLDALAAEIASAGGRALAVPGDVTSESDMRALVDRAIAAFGRLDVMICNAGIGFHGTLDDTPPEAARRLLDVNLMGTYFPARAALACFRAQGAGHLIVISSIVARRGVAGSGWYGLTKAGQLGLVESLRAEFAGTKIHASVVLPISTDTEFRDAMRRDFGQEIGGIGPRQSADAVAAAIARCIRRPKAEVYPYRLSWWLAVLDVLAPSWADRFVKRFARRNDAGRDFNQRRHDASSRPE